MGDGQSCSSLGPDSSGSSFLLTAPGMFTDDSSNFNLEQGFYDDPLGSLPPLVSLGIESDFEALPGRSLDIGQPVISGQTWDFYGESLTACLTDLSNPNMPGQRSQNGNVHYRPLDRKNYQGGPTMPELGKTEVLPSPEPSQATTVNFWDTFDALKDHRTQSFQSHFPANFPFSCKLSPLSHTSPMFLQHLPSSLQSAPPSTAEPVLSNNEEKDVTILPERAKSNKLLPPPPSQMEFFLSRRYGENPNITSSPVKKTDWRRKPRAVALKQPGETAAKIPSIPSSEMSRTYGLVEGFRSNGIIMSDLNSDPWRKTKRKRCGECAGCVKKDNCGKCAPCTNNNCHRVCNMRRCAKLTEKKPKQIWSRKSNGFLNKPHTPSFHPPGQLESELSIGSKGLTFSVTRGIWNQHMPGDTGNKIREGGSTHPDGRMSAVDKQVQNTTVFEEEASTWEGKLDCGNPLFDVWNDVHKRWVYLEGMFTNNVDLKTLLPVETSRFHSIRLTAYKV